MLSRWWGALLFGSFWTGAAHADAGCLFAPTPFHHVEVELRTTDTSAPESPVLVEAAAFRRKGMTCTLASCVASSCGNTGTVRIALAPAADDRTPRDELGYRLVHVSGLLPESMQDLIGIDLAADGDRPFFLRPTFEEVPALDVTLAAVAIDAAGNESAPGEPFVVRFDGCTLAAVGDECEDELDPATDLSEVFQGDPLEEALPPSRAGVSCSLMASRAPAPAWWVLIGCGLLFLGAARRVR